MGDQDLPITGACQCGAIVYQLTEPPRDVGYCHCRMCQKSQGSIFSVSGEWPRAALVLRRGEPKWYRSSNVMERGFCDGCGCSLFGRYDGEATLWVYFGSLDRPDDLAPRWHLCAESKMPWCDLRDTLPRVRSDRPDVVPTPPR